MINKMACRRGTSLALPSAPERAERRAVKVDHCDCQDGSILPLLFQATIQPATACYLHSYPSASRLDQLLAFKGKVEPSVTRVAEVTFMQKQRNVNLRGN